MLSSWFLLLLFRLNPNHPARKSFSIKDKREFILSVDSIVSTGASRREACTRLGLPHMYYERFKKAIEKVESLENGTGYIPYKTNNSARKIHPGPPSLLCVIKDNLLILLCRQGTEEYRSVPV